MGDTEARRDFPDNDQRYAFCNSVWEDARQQMNSEQQQLAVHGITTVPATGTVETFVYVVHAVLAAPRRDVHQNRPFRVVPAVLVRSQVLHNNIGAALLPPEEFTDEWASQWNGIPVLVGDHPSRRGVPVSARDPALIDTRGVGWIFNAAVDDDPDEPDVRRLTGEVWLDETRASDVTGLQQIFDDLDAGNVVELSTGFATQIERRTGAHNGRQYDVVMHPMGADHLVISSEFTGACSVDDGCGLGANENLTAVNAEDVSNMETQRRGWLTGLLRRVTATVGTEPKPMTDDEYDAKLLEREIEIWNQLTLSDDERAAMIQESLQKQHGDADRHAMVVAVYSEAQEVVYWFETPLGPQPPGAEFFRSTWSQDAESSEFKFGDPTRVRRVVSYEPVTAGNESVENKNEPDNDEEVGEMGNVDNRDDGGMDVQQLAAKVDQVVDAVGALAARFAQFEEAANAEPTNPAIAGLKAEIAKLSHEFSEMRGVTKAAVDERERERVGLVNELSGNFRCAYTADELNTKPLDELRKIADMVRGDNYAGRGGPRDGASVAEQRFVEPVPYYAKTDDKN